MLPLPNKTSLFLGCIGLCLLGGILEPWNKLLVFDRSAIAAGQIWRMWTGHFVHFGPDHLLPNLFVSAVLMILFRQVTRKEAAIILAVIPVMISGALLYLCPELEVYAGFSGVASALTVRLVIERLSNNLKDAISWLLAFGFTFKLAWELFSNATLFVVFSEDSIRVEPIAHLAGATAMILVFLATSAAEKLRSSESKSLRCQPTT